MAALLPSSSLKFRPNDGNRLDAGYQNLLHQEKEDRVCYLVGAICSRDVITLTPEDSLFTAMQHFDLKGVGEI